MTKLSAGNLIMTLAVLLVGPPITQPLPRRTPITILLPIIPKMTLTEWPFLFMQSLPLTGNYDFDPLRVNLLQLLCIGISRIGTSHLTGLWQHLMGLLNLPGKLIHIAGLAYRLRMHNETMLVIHHALHIVTGMAPLNTVHNRTVRIGLIDLLSIRIREGLQHFLNLTF
jgi:hypothetical protein